MTSTRTFRGITFGVSPFIITDESGFDDITIRTGSRPFPRSDGNIPGDDYAGAREIVLRGWIDADDAATAHAALQELKTAATVVRSGSHPYVATMPDGSAVFVNARVAERRIPRSVDTEVLGRIPWSIGFRADDPRVYDVAAAAINVPLFVVDPPGFDLPAELPVDMPDAAPTYAIATNDGNADAWPVFEIDYLAGGTGEFDGFVLTNITTGVVVTVDAALSAGQRATIDFDTYTRATGVDPVVIGGTPNFGAWQHAREPMALTPGSNTIKLEVSGASPTNDVAARLTWRNTSL